MTLQQETCTILPPLPRTSLKHFPLQAQPYWLISGYLRKVQILQFQALTNKEPNKKSLTTLIVNQMYLQTGREIQQAWPMQQVSHGGEADCLPRTWKQLLLCPYFRRDPTTERVTGTQTFQVPPKPNSSIFIVVLPQIFHRLPSKETFVIFPYSTTWEAITKSLQVFLLLSKFIFISNFKDSLQPTLKCQKALKLSVPINNGRFMLKYIYISISQDSILHMLLKNTLLLIINQDNSIMHFKCIIVLTFS